MRVSAVGRERMSNVSHNYGTVGSWLDDAAKADPAFDRSKPYAIMINQAALNNAVALGNWGDWVSGVQSNCREALTYLADNKNQAGPIAQFDRAIQIANQLQMGT